jgi:hypothetical protein
MRRILPFALLVMGLFAAHPAAAARRSAAKPRALPVLITLVNHTEQPIRELFAIPAGANDWGADQLDGKPIAAGERFSLRHKKQPGCTWDVRVVFADGTTRDHRGVDVCAMPELEIGPDPQAAAIDPQSGKAADDPSFRLFNRAAIAMVGVFARPSGMTDWGPDRLARGATLPPDGKLAVSLPRNGNCFYDLRIVFADHATHLETHTDLCRYAAVPEP